MEESSGIRMLSARDIRRKAVHIFIGVFAAIFYYLGFLNWQITGIALVLGAVLSWYSKTHFVPVIDTVLDFLDRKEDRKKFPGKGALFFTLGVFLAMVLFPREIGVASIMVLALGDGISALLGPLGKIKNPFNKVKLIEGTAAGIIAGFIGAVIFVSPLQAFFGAFVAMVLEAIDIVFLDNKIDDNIIVPVVAGAVMLLF